MLTKTHKKETMNVSLFVFCVVIILLEIWYFILVHHHFIPTLSAKKCISRKEVHTKGPFELFKKALQMIDDGCMSITDFLHLAFRQETKEQFYFDNVCSFFSWATYGAETWQLDPEQFKQIVDFVQHLESRFGVTFPSGFNVSVKHIRHSLEDIEVCHRPIVTYLLNFAFDELYVRTKMHFLKFRQCRQSKRLKKYWIYPAASSAKDAIVVFHGISTGMFNYIKLLSAIRKVHPDKTVFLIEYPWILMRHEFNVPTPFEFTNEVKNVIHSHGFSQAAFIGHSFGTIFCSWMHTYFPDMVTNITLIDPVALILPLPFVAFNFMYRKPSSLVEWGIYNLYSREISISNVLRRHFEWSHNVLYIDDICSSKKINIFVAGGDEVNCGKTIKKYVLKHTKQGRRNINMVYKPDMGHSDILHDPNELRDFVSTIFTS